MLRSLRLEATLGKDEILRDYLNLVPQGNNLMGVETAARIYFGKPAAQVTLAEAALLAALAKAPGTLNPLGHEHRRLLSRRNWVLTRLARLGFVSREQVTAARQTGLRLRVRATFFRLKRRISSIWSWPPAARRRRGSSIPLWT